MAEDPSQPIAAAWPADVRALLQRLAVRVLATARGRVPPLGWTGLAPALVALAGDPAIAAGAGAFTTAAARLGLTELEQLALISIASPELDGRFVGAWQLVGGRVDVVRPRLGHLIQLAPAEERAQWISLLDPAAWLRTLGLVRVDGEGLAAELTADLAALGTEVRPAEVIRGERDPQAPAPALDLPPRRRTPSDPPPSAIVLEGAPGAGRGRRAGQLAAGAGLGVAWVALTATGVAAQVASAVRAAVREHAVPCFCLDGLEADADRCVLELVAALAGYAGPVMLAAQYRPTLPGPWRTRVIAVPRPDVAARQVLWAEVLGGAAPEALVTELARRFPLGRGGIVRAADIARFRGDGSLDPIILGQAAREQIELRSSLAERIRSTRTLADLIASPSTVGLIEEIIAFAKHRRAVFDDWGFARSSKGGLKVLFSGPPGTGKTMSAEIIAAELDLDLYRIDLSNVVSKWIGETEKNLKQVFDLAETNGGVLLFDEADALFGKRTSNVQSSNDRYANMEINYLLQRMEEFDGVCLLTTNIETGIDEAFKRRLNFRVRFLTPEPAERERLWALMIPAQAPRTELDFEEVAERFDMTGGNIRNAAIRAAVLAAAEGNVLSTRHLIEAATREFGEIGRITR